MDSDQFHYQYGRQIVARANKPNLITAAPLVIAAEIKAVALTGVLLADKKAQAAAAHNDLILLLVATAVMMAVMLKIAVQVKPAHF